MQQYLQQVSQEFCFVSFTKQKNIREKNRPTWLRGQKQLSLAAFTIVPQLPIVLFHPTHNIFPAPHPS